MGLFSKGDAAKKAKPSDAIVLCTALRQLLSELAEEIPRAEAQRVRDLVDRLDRYPTPTGLEREVERLVKFLRTSALGAGSTDFADTAGAMADAMQRVSIMDRELTKTIKALRDQVPLRVRPGDARVLAAAAQAVERVAEEARFRQQESQAAVVALLDAVGMHIKEANLSSDAMDEHLGQLAKGFADAGDASALFALRGELNQHLMAMRDVSSDVRTDLTRAQARVGELEGTIRLQQEELRDVRAELTLDALTNVANRSAFDEVLVQALISSRRTNGPVSLMMMDLDHFKKVNDTYGHPSGDDVLRTVSQIVVQQVRNDDFVARIGGEEFAVVLPSTGKREAAGVAARVRDAVRRLSFSKGAENFSVTISIGLACWDRFESAESLYSRADQALYQAKRNGRDRYVAV
jgi:diguanylate cyclase